MRWKSALLICSLCSCFIFTCLYSHDLHFLINSLNSLNSFTLKLNQLELICFLFNFRRIIGREREIQKHQRRIGSNTQRITRLLSIQLVASITTITIKQLPKLLKNLKKNFYYYMIIYY